MCRWLFLPCSLCCCGAVRRSFGRPSENVAVVALTEITAGGKFCGVVWLVVWRVVVFTLKGNVVMSVPAEDSQCSLGHAIIDLIVSSALFRMECPEHPEAGCMAVWSANAPEQIEQLVRERMAAGLNSTPAITVPDNVLIDPFPAEDAASPTEPEMWRWTNWERGGVLNGYRLTVFFRVVDGVIVSDQYEKGVFLPEFLKPWVGKSLAELQLWRRQTEVVGQYAGVLKRVGEF